MRIYRSRTSKSDGRIIIAGTGRTGTTFLVQLFTALGFDTGFTLQAAIDGVDQISQAGLEYQSLSDADNPYVIKSPLFAGQLLTALEEKRIGIHTAIVPMRGLSEAAASRRRVHSDAIAKGIDPNQQPGGLWYTTNPEAQESALTYQFYRTIFPLVKFDINLILIKFPELVSDEKYLFGKLKELLEDHGVDYSEFANAHKLVARPERVHGTWCSKSPASEIAPGTITHDQRRAGSEAAPELNYFNQKRQEMLRFVPARRRRVLEIGCGEGGFSATLTAVEETWGIEPSPAAEVAKNRLTRVYHATFDEAEASLPLYYFDLIICNDVIEHLPDHSSFLFRVGRYVAPGGMIVGSIPNVRFYDVMFRYLFERNWRYADWGVLDRTHLWFFTRKSFRSTLKRHGFSVLKVRGINAWCLPPRSVRTLLYLPLAYALIIMTFGYFWDIRYLQFAFQAVPRR